MDCNIFRKKLQDLIEENIELDLKKAMLSHIENCQACKTLYEEEVAVEEGFRAAFSINSGNFRSLRPEIMKNIDKNRYGNSPFKKCINHIKKYKANYTALVAATAAIIFVTPYITKQGLGTRAESKAAPEVASKSAQSDENRTMMSLGIQDNAAGGVQDQSIAQSTEKKSSMDEANNNTKINVDAYIPQFEKKDMQKDFKVTFNTPWEVSKTGKYSAAVEGRGEEASEEGIGIIVVKDKTGQQWSFSLQNNDGKQYTPKKLKWIDDKNLLITVGWGYGMVHVGGVLYALNVETNTVTKPNPNNIEAGTLSEITKILSVEKTENNSLKINVEYIVYEDSDLNKSRNENGTIITDSLSK